MRYEPQSQYPFPGWEGIIGVSPAGRAHLTLPQPNGQHLTVVACDWVWPYTMTAVAKSGGEARFAIASSHPTREFVVRWVRARSKSPLGVDRSTLERLSLVVIVEGKVLVRLPLDVAMAFNDCYFLVNGLEDFYVRVEGGTDHFDVAVDAIGAYKAPVK